MIRLPPRFPRRSPPTLPRKPVPPMFHIAINRVQSGPFSETELRQRLARGEIGANDLCWKEGWPAWRKVGEVFPPAEPPVLPSAPPPLGAPAPGNPFTTPPPQAPGKSSGLATASLVCGICVFVLFPLFFLFAIVAVVLGHVAHSKIKASGGTLGGGGAATAGLIMGYLGIAGIPVIGLLAAMAIPAFQKVRHHSQEMTVRNNLTQLWCSAEQRMLETGGDSVTYAELVAPGGYLQPLKSVAGESYDGIVIHRGDESIEVTLQDGRTVTYYSSSAVGNPADATAPALDSDEDSAEEPEEEEDKSSEPPPAETPQPEAALPCPASA